MTHVKKAGRQPVLNRAMAYIFHQDQLPKLVSAVPGRERTFFVDSELAKTDDMLAGIMRYRQGASSPLHLHESCEHFYFIIEGTGVVETPEGRREAPPGTMVFIPALAEHRLRAVKSPLLYFEFQAPNRFKTTILEGTAEDLKWNRVNGGVWWQS